MRDREIEVLNSCCKNEIKVTLKGYPVIMDTISNLTMIWLSEDEADRLAFHINSQLQENEIFRREEESTKYDERRDFSKMEPVE